MAKAKKAPKPGEPSRTAATSNKGSLAKGKASQKKVAANKGQAVEKKKSVASQKVSAGAKKQSPGLKVVPKVSARKRMTMSESAQILATQPTGSSIPPYQEKVGEEYMSPKQQEHFRKILLLWKQQLLQEMDRTVHHLQDEAANFPDPNDRATQEEEFSLELRTRDRERKLIRKIEEALQKIDEGEYGYCDSCGVEIGVRRLEARPTANLCIDCKTLDEIREKQMGS